MGPQISRRRRDRHAQAWQAGTSGVDDEDSPQDFATQPPDTPASLPAQGPDTADLPPLFPPESNRAVELREERMQGSRYIPPSVHAATLRAYRRICDALESEVRNLEDFLVDGSLTEEGEPVATEIEGILEQLYQYPLGEGENLKRVIVAINFQIRNARWTRKHVEFLAAAVSFLRARTTILEAHIETLLDMIVEHGLDPFRGTIAEPEVIARYRIEKVEER
jgi:cell division protein FtsB